jgi:hypothetical protein
VPALEEGLRRSLAVSPPGVGAREYAAELPKFLVAALGRHAAGRAGLIEWLDATIPTRVRVEAAIQSTRGDATSATALAGACLAQDFAACDSELGVRVLEALGRVADEQARSFLYGVIAEEAQAFELRLAALDTLASLGDRERLELVLREVGAPDLRVSAARALGRGRDPEGLAWLEAQLELRRSDFLASGHAALEDAEALCAGEFLLALVRRDALPLHWTPLILARPTARATARLAQRFRGESAARVEFTWGLELDLVHDLARSGRLAEVLDADTNWTALDGRLLAALSARAVEGVRQAQGEDRKRRGWLACERLARAAGIALAGEASAVDLGALEVELRLRLLLTAEERDAWDAHAAGAQRLLDGWLLGDLPDRAVENALGTRCLKEGVDAAARLRSAREQALAHAAVLRGEPSAACAHARRAAELVGASIDAAHAQARLEAMLD